MIDIRLIWIFLKFLLCIFGVYGMTSLLPFIFLSSLNKFTVNFLSKYLVISTSKNLKSFIYSSCDSLLQWFILCDLDNIAMNLPLSYSVLLLEKSSTLWLCKAKSQVIEWSIISWHPPQHASVLRKFYFVKNTFSSMAKQIEGELSCWFSKAVDGAFWCLFQGWGSSWCFWL